ncbi:MAG: flagellar basal body rod protein FlgB [Myxococcota bacterium]
MKLFEPLNASQRVLDYHLDRHGVLASNLANVDTPGYRARDLSFSRYLDQFQGASTLSTTSSGHLGGQSTSGNSLYFDEEPPRGDDNTVRLERAMAQVAANRVRYEAVAEIVKGKLAGLRYAATDGAES